MGSPYVYNNIYDLAAFLNKKIPPKELTHLTLRYKNEFHNKNHDNSDHWITKETNINLLQNKTPNMRKEKCIVHAPFVATDLKCITTQFSLVNLWKFINFPCVLSIQLRRLWSCRKIQQLKLKSTTQPIWIWHSSYDWWRLIANAENCFPVWHSRYHVVPQLQNNIETK